MRPLVLPSRKAMFLVLFASLIITLTARGPGNDPSQAGKESQKSRIGHIRQEAPEITTPPLA